jgi:hypothetical protein
MSNKKNSSMSRVLEQVLGCESVKPKDLRKEQLDQITEMIREKKAQQLFSPVRSNSVKSPS